MSDSSNPNPDWYPDPTGRFEQRYWDGAQWTEHVSSAGQQRTDPLPGAEPQASTGEDLPSLGDLSQGAGLIEPTPDTTPPPGWGDAAPMAAEPTPAAAPAQPEPVAPTPEPAAGPAFVDAGQAVAATPVASGPAPDWYADPTGRYEQRYWDGTTWTEHVTAAGQQGIDPLPDAEGASSDQSDQSDLSESDQSGAAVAEESADAAAPPDAGVNPFAAAAEPAESAAPAPVADVPAPDEPATEGTDGGAGLPPVPGIDSPGVGSAGPPAASVPVASAAPPPVGAADGPGDPATSVMPPAVDPPTEAMPATDPASPDEDAEGEDEDGDDEDPTDEGPSDGGGGPGPASEPAPAAAGPPPDWYPDPTGRQELRYWDGVQWTEHGSSGGQQVVDPIGDGLG